MAVEFWMAMTMRAMYENGGFSVLDLPPDLPFELAVSQLGEIKEGERDKDDESSSLDTDDDGDMGGDKLLCPPPLTTFIFKLFFSDEVEDVDEEEEDEEEDAAALAFDISPELVNGCNI